MDKRKPVKLVISDVDGTIFDCKDTMTDSLALLREQIRKYEVPFTLASGRSYQNLEGLVDYLGLKLPVIVNNGAGIVHGDRLLWEMTLENDDVRDAVELADRYGMFVALYDSAHETVYRHNEYVQSYIDRFQKHYTYLLGPNETLTDKTWRGLRMEKLLFIDPEKPGRVEEIIGRLKNRDEALAVVRYDDRSMDVMPKGCDKRSAVQRLAETLEVGLEQVAAVGDNENDIQMIKAVGVGCAVANATDSLKRFASYVCRGAGADGVAEVVQTFYMNEKREGG